MDWWSRPFKNMAMWDPLPLLQCPLYLDRIQSDEDVSMEQGMDRGSPDDTMEIEEVTGSGDEGTEPAESRTHGISRTSFARAGKEVLKLTWPYEELKSRDAGQNAAMFTKRGGECCWPGTWTTWTWTWNGPRERKNSRLQCAYDALEKAAQHAFAALQGARRTLRDARERHEEDSQLLLLALLKQKNQNHLALFRQADCGCDLAHTSSDTVVFFLSVPTRVAGTSSLT